MYDEFLINTLPLLEDHSRDSGFGYAVFLYEQTLGVYFSEYIRVFRGYSFFRCTDVDSFSPEDNYNRIINSIPESVALIYHWLSPTNNNAIIILRGYDTSSYSILDTIR